MTDGHSLQKMLRYLLLTLMACLSCVTTSRLSDPNLLSSRLLLVATSEGGTPREQQSRSQAFSAQPATRSYPVLLISDKSVNMMIRRAESCGKAMALLSCFCTAHPPVIVSHHTYQFIIPCFPRENMIIIGWLPCF